MRGRGSPRRSLRTPACSARPALLEQGCHSHSKIPHQSPAPRTGLPPLERDSFRGTRREYATSVRSPEPRRKAAEQRAQAASVKKNVTASCPIDRPREAGGSATREAIESLVRREGIAASRRTDRQRKTLAT